MSTIINNINNIPNDPSLPILCIKFYDAAKGLIEAINNSKSPVACSNIDEAKERNKIAIKKLDNYQDDVQPLYNNL